MSRRDRRHPHQASGPGRARAHRIQRELTLESGPEGVRLIDPDALPEIDPEDPCGECACCGKWQSLLTHLKAAIGQHRPALKKRRCPVKDCLICNAERTW